MTRRYCQETDDPVVRRLFQCQMGDAEIGLRLDVDPRAVGSARQRLNLGWPKGRPPAINRPTEPLAPAFPEPTNPVLIAVRTLYPRVSEKDGAYRLDSVPISAPDLVRAANRKRVEDGRPQIGPEAWRV